MLTECDVGIVGGGVAGCGTAIALRNRRPLSIALIHKAEARLFPVGETLQPQARELAEKLGILEELRCTPHLPSNGVCSAWGDSTLAYNDYLFKASGKGWLLDRAAFDLSLLDKARRGGVHIVESSYSCLDSGADGRWLLSTRNGAVIRCRFVVDATGRRSAVADGLGVPRIRFDELHAVYALWEGRPEVFPHHTLVESVESGWCYAAALPAERFVTAYFTDKAQIKANRLTQPDRLLPLLSRAPNIGRLLSASSKLVGTRVVVADSSMLDFAGSEKGWLAVGDAASAYDPLSSLGIAKALGGSLAAAGAIDSWLGGESGEVDAYCRNIESGFDQYLAQRHHYYGLESRWKKDPFWKQRQDWIGIHPDWVLQRSGLRKKIPNRIVSSEVLEQILAAFGDEARRAHEAVRLVRGALQRRFSDYRLIQAMRYLVESGHLAVQASDGGVFGL